MNDVSEDESFINEDDKPRKRFKEIHTCEPINSACINWSVPAVLCVL